MSRVPYDRHYAEPHLFGGPLPALRSFFEALLPRRYVWDLGAGQGRDSLLLAGIGHRVLAIDESNLGLQQILKESPRSTRARLGTRRADIYHLAIPSDCEVVLLDAMFHFYRRDREREVGLLTRLSGELGPGGILAIAIVRTPRTTLVLSSLLEELWQGWSRLADEVSKHESSNTDYRFLALCKPEA